MDNRLHRLEAFQNPHETAQMTQCMFWTRVEFFFVDMSDERSNIGIFRWQDHRVFFIIADIRINQSTPHTHRSSLVDEGVVMAEDFVDSFRAGVVRRW